MSLRVLLVEDNQLNADLVTAILGREGHAVEVLPDGAALRARLAHAPPDLVLMDILLPDTDGITLAEELRARAGWTLVPLVAVTAQALAGDRERFLLAGFREVVIKPIDTRTLSAVVERLACRAAAH